MSKCTGAWHIVVWPVHFTLVPCSHRTPLCSHTSVLQAVFGQVRYNGDAPSGTYISPFTITVTECTKDHVKFSVACLGSVYVSSEQDDDEVKSVGLATPPNDERKLPVLPTSTGIYDCLWNSDYSIDWRAWAIDPNENNTQCDDIAIYHPQSVFKVDADTSAPTYAPKTTSPTPSPTVVPPPSSEKPFHAITKLSTTTTRASVTQIMFASYGTCLKIEVPPGMIGMVYIDSVENTQDYLQVFGLSLGINPGDTSQSFFADVYSANGEDISPKLSLAWFAWNGTGTNCPKDKDGVVCGGHGVCPDGGDEGKRERHWMRRRAAAAAKLRQQSRDLIGPRFGSKQT